MVFLANENFPRRSIVILREKGYNIISVFEEMRGAADIDVLKRAVKENLVILTFDKDYGEMIFRHKEIPPPGVAYFRLDNDLPEHPALILSNLIEIYKINLEGFFTVVEFENIRQRKISIK
jgi:predicted nuclease of predicted toxin-antitoxin system